MPTPLNNKKRRGDRLVDSLLVHRVFHCRERMYLTGEVQGLIYRYLTTEEIPLEITERAILESVSIGMLKNSAVGTTLFEDIVEALLEDRSFETPGFPAEMVDSSNCWIC